MNSNKENLTFEELQHLLEVAEKKGEPIDQLVKSQISLLEKAHDEFIRKALDKGYKRENPKLAEIEVAQFTAMKQLALKIGLPSEPYDKLIRETRIRIFGEENYKKFFEN